MNACGVVGVQLRLFLTPAIDGYVWSALIVGQETPVPTGWEAGWAAELVWALGRS
jgi:hypothetical protein